MGQKKIRMDDSSKLKSLLSEESLDEKFDEFYTDRVTTKDDIALENQEKIDFKAEYDKHIAPKVRAVSGAVVGACKKLAPKLGSVANIAAKKLGVVGWSVGIVGVLVAVLAINLFGGAVSDESVADVQGVSVIDQNNVTTDAPFEVVASETAAELRYDEDRQVASYGDLIEGRQVVVSQQQLNPQQVLDDLFVLNVAQSFNISTEFQSDKGGVFIGENREQQTQTAIFKHDGKLVFIQVQGLLLPAQITEYISAL